MILDEPELKRWGESIGATVPSAVITLVGPLGAGKSVLARAIGRGAGVRESMPSPTYNLVYRYPGERTAVRHFDLYRLSDADEVWELGWSQLLAEPELVLIEWPERAQELLPRDRWRITLSIPPDDVRARDVNVDRIGNPPELPPFPMTVSADE